LQNRVNSIAPIPTGEQYTSFQQPSTAARRGHSFAFASRLSNRESSGSLEDLARRQRNQSFGSSAASDEQGNSSMCSFDGDFINVTED
jgi:hypothetical protein